MSEEQLFGTDSESEDSDSKQNAQSAAENQMLSESEEEEIPGVEMSLESEQKQTEDVANDDIESDQDELHSPSNTDHASKLDDEEAVTKKSSSAPTQEDIFGEELDVSSEEEDVNEQQEQNKDAEVAEETKEEPAEEGVAIEIELPTVDESIGDEIFFVKLPNFLSVETKPFDSAFYEDEIDDDEVLDEEGRARLKLKVENTIRWRSTKDFEGNDVKESNARIVRWSDGSLSLHMGNEIFDIFKMPIEGLQNHLFVQQGTGLQAKSVFKEKLTFRPHSTKSQTHLKMTMSIADRVSKSQKIRLIPVTERDPEAARQEMTKKEEERMRAQLRRESQQRRIRERSHSKGLTANYLESERYEDDEQELEESLAAIKSRYKKDIQAGRARNIKDIYSDEDSDGDNKLLNAKMNLSSDEEGPRGTKRKPSQEESTKKKKTTRKIIESEDDSE